MARPITITTRNLKELQRAMKSMETAVEPTEVRPILAGALEIFHSKALELLHRLTRRTKDLPPGWEHIEDAFQVKQGKGQKIASAFAKVFRRAAPQAIWIEFGHRIVTRARRVGSAGKPVHSKHDTGRRVVAFPFFRTALDTTRKDMLRYVRNGIKALLASVAKRAGFRGGSSPDDTGWIG